ncbi:DJ-1/PfpI family protein [Paenibacillus sp. PK3_47]|uniref:DJ-1/PfpI family protein n=1 Tax=Paenibacillus sp. PK3_47 TaxID=2072642 RepID=UPI00201E4267|nr:DJ-1/PfpI family protein [Paenibacillus sp. PK3_47]
MNTYILIYDGFVQFEVVLAAYFMKTKSEVYTLGLEKRPFDSCEGFSTNPAKVIGELDTGAVDVLVIPGGDTAELARNEKLLELVRRLNAAGTTIAAICGGVEVLKAAGVLEGKRYAGNPAEAVSAGTSVQDNAVVDGNILTALPNGYVDFALELGRMMNIYKDGDDLQETIDFFKYFKAV